MKKLLALLMVAGFVSTSHADLLLEPYLGYYMGTSTQSGSKDGDVSGVGYGARIGYQNITGLMLGAEYFTGALEDDDGTVKTDLTPGDYGVFAGFNFPILLRAYATYFIKNKWKSKTSTTTSDLEGDGGLKLGLGWTGLPFISINFEYMTVGFDKVGGNSIDDTINEKIYGLSVSLPLTF